MNRTGDPARSAGPGRDAAVVFALGLAMALYWLGTTHPQFNEDSLQYLANARKLSGQPHLHYDSNRPPGYSLFMVLTGVTWLGTFRWLVAAQALLGLAVPLLVHRTLLPLGRAPALAVALGAAIVPIPYVYAGMVMTEQLSIFLLFLFVFLASRHLAGRPPVYLFLAAPTAFAMVLTRPASGLVFWLFLLVSLLARRRVRELLPAAAVYCALLLAWSAVDWLGVGRGDRLSPCEQPATRRAEQRFGKAYFRTWSRNFEDYGVPRALIVPARGPASRALYDRLARVLREKPALWVSREPRAWFGAHAGNPDALLGELFLRPNLEYYDFITEAVCTELGPAATEELFASVAREYGEAGWRGFLANLSLGVSSRLGGASLFWEAYVAGRHHGAYDPDRPFRIVRAENGPATRQLQEAVRLHAAAWAGPGQETAASLLESDEIDFSALIKKVTVRLYGLEASDRLLRDVALEAFRAYPKSALLFWDNFVMLAAGPNDVLYSGGKRNTDLAGVLYLSSRTEELPARLRAEVSGDRPPTPFFDALYRAAHLLKPLILLVCLVCLPFAWAGPARPLVILLLLLVGSQYAIVSVLSQPHQRYVDHVYLLVVMAAAIGVRGARRRSGVRGPEQPAGGEDPSDAAEQV